MTRDSETGTIVVWGMNFLFGEADDPAKTFEISLENLGIDPGRITLKRLADLTGRTTLLSSRVGSTDVPSVGWITTDLTGDVDLSNYQFTINPAELSMLIIEVPEPSASAGAIVLLHVSSCVDRRWRIALRTRRASSSGGARCRP